MPTEDIPRQVTFVDHSADAEMANAAEHSLITTIDSASDDEDDDTLKSEVSDQVANARLEIYTNRLKELFLLIICQFSENTSGISVDTTYEIRTVKTGTSSFTSNNDGRYHFCLPGQERVGGAEIFGTDDKHRGTLTSTSTRHEEKLQIQVAGEMLATVMHRDIFKNKPNHEEEILQACPNLQRIPMEVSRTVYYLVFTHLSLRIAKAVFDHSYMKQVFEGYLKKDSKLNVMWSHRLQLNDQDDLRKAAKLVMCLTLNLKDECESGQHYWLPYQIEREEGLVWVTE